MCGGVGLIDQGEILNVVFKVLPWEMRRNPQDQCCRGAEQATGEGEPSLEEAGEDSQVRLVLASAESI